MAEPKRIEFQASWSSSKEDKGVIVQNKTKEKGNAARISIDAPGEHTISAQFAENNDLYDAFSFRLFVPEEMPKGIEIIFHIKDVDFWWYQRLLPGNPIPGKWNEYSISFDETAGTTYDHSARKYNWSSRGHYRPFDPTILRKMREMGITIKIPEYERRTAPIEAKERNTRKDESDFLLADQYLTERMHEAVELCVANLDFARTVQQYEKFEARFDLSRCYANPFDPDIIDVTGHFVTPSGKEFTYPCFYFQDYVREKDGEYEKLIPVGTPCWKLRIAPLETGKYTFWITVNDKKSKVSTPKMEFTSTNPISKGFVRVSRKDPLYFEFSDESFFYPIGLNLHCTYDDRFHNVTMDKGPTEVRDHPGDSRTSRGGYIIDRRSYVHTDIFEKMRQNGMNATEIWLASWGYEIEWRGDWKGFAGINQYNMENAWRLDLVMESAHQNDIFLNLVFHCHGQFSWGGIRGEDGEFNNHPYNRINGGFLRDSIQIFYEDKAFNYLMKRMRYVVARYGYSRNIFSWEIISETDLTAASVSAASRNFVLKYTEKLKEMDVHKRPVTNHYSGDYNITDARLMKEPSMDFITGDAYRGWVGRGAPFRFPPFYEMLEQTSESWNRFKKPGLVTECGCCWFGGPEYALFNDVHQVCWATWMTHLAGTSLFWWFEYVDEKDLYWHYKAFSKFTEGEDKRGRNLHMASLDLNTNSEDKPDLTMVLLTNEKGGYVWIYDIREYDIITKSSIDQGIYFETRNYDAPEFRGIQVPVRGLLQGKYNVESWDTCKGEILTSTVLETTASTITVQLPPFRKDIAIKVKPVN